MTQTENKNSSKKWLIGLLALIVAIAALFGIYRIFGAKPSAGTKAITIAVVDDTGSTTVYESKTDAEYLRQAMEEIEDLTFSGADSEFGIMIDTVNGIRADYALDNAYWSFYVNEEYCNYGVDTQPVNDKDAFRIVYTPAE